MRFSKELLEQIRSAADLRSFLPQQPARGNNNCSCPHPDHEDKNPSCKATETYFECFSCGAKGDVFELFQIVHAVDFPAAVQMVADEVGVELPAEGRGGSAPNPMEERLKQINLAAAKYFRSKLRDTIGQSARSYLECRGVSSESVEKFMLGYAPGNGSKLQQYMRKCGFTLEELDAAGLITRKNGIVREVFQDRLMIPIRDRGGQVVGFGGRALRADDKIKYLNTKETPVFKKRRILFNAESIRDNRDGEAFVVEGYFDCIIAAQDGIAAAAPMGTAITQEQLKAVSSGTAKLVFVFDPDVAGEQAAERAAIECFKASLSKTVIEFGQLRGDEDPAELIARVGGDGFRKATSDRVPLHQMVLKALAPEPIKSPEEGAQVMSKFDSVAKDVRSPEIAHQYRAFLQAKINHWYAAA